jgi:hypothetical protein
LANLPKRRPKRWAAGDAAEDMAALIWMPSRLVIELALVEWTLDKETTSHYTDSSTRTLSFRIMRPSNPPARHLCMAN